jgi:GT2 family glycosyltransferase
MLGIVAIGRNEGDRLKACLAAASAVRSAGQPATVVYVDSGSTDGSRDAAVAAGAHVVELDLSKPFTAARARNEGFDRLMSVAPDCRFVQFLDGDCVLQGDWIDRALRTFGEKPQAAVVCGRRREKFPDATIYNKLCDVEWDTPVGRALASGGDALVKVEAFQKVGGYNSGVIAGEEPEMCVRLRAAGYEIWRIDAEMTLHDAAMTRFGQWWNRTLRAGHAYAEGAAMHGQPPERHWVKEVRSNYVWGLIMPLTALLLAWPTYGLSLLLFAAYPLLGYRVYKYYKGRGVAPRDARLVAFFVAIGKLPSALGQLKYRWRKLTGQQSKIIEYKTATT